MTNYNFEFNLNPFNLSHANAERVGMNDGEVGSASVGGVALCLCYTHTTAKLKRNMI